MFCNTEKITQNTHYILYILRCLDIYWFIECLEIETIQLISENVRHILTLISPY